MMINRYYWAICMACVFSLCVKAQQESVFLSSYRQQVLDYNHRLKSAGYTENIADKNVNSARAGFLPQISAEADLGYVVNPSEFSGRLTTYDIPFSIQGRHTKYGASLVLTQPLYTGGALKAGYRKARKEMESARYETQRIRNDVVYDADVYYWKYVAQKELSDVAGRYCHSVGQLVDLVRSRVEAGYSDRNDLLMSEVKLNEAEYQFLRAENNVETARMALNSFAGIDFSKQLATDSVVLPLKEAGGPVLVSEVLEQRPEIGMVQNEIEISRYDARIANAVYKPQFSIGMEGSYASPGYDFRADLDPNYAVFAKLTVPIYEWGKRKNTKNIGQYKTKIAEENRNRVVDEVTLEISTAQYDYRQAVEKVKLTESSLQKARESEMLALDRYKEGRISIVEVINAQLYHQQAAVNYIQSKYEACIALSHVERAIGTVR